MTQVIVVPIIGQAEEPASTPYTVLVAGGDYAYKFDSDLNLVATSPLLPGDSSPVTVFGIAQDGDGNVVTVGENNAEVGYRLSPTLTDPQPWGADAFGVEDGYQMSIMWDPVTQTFVTKGGVQTDADDSQTFLVWRLDPVTGDVVARYVPSAGVFGSLLYEPSAIDPDSRRYYFRYRPVGDSNSSSIYALDLDTGVVTTFVDLPLVSSDILGVRASDGAVAIHQESTDIIEWYDRDTATVLSTVTPVIPPEFGIYYFRVAPDGSIYATTWASADGASGVAKWDADGALLATWGVPPATEVWYMGGLNVMPVAVAPTDPDPTISVVDSFDRADTTAGTLGTTSDGLATWENEDPDPGFGFRILANVARGSGGTNHQTIDVLGTTPGIVSGTLVRGASAAQGSVALLYGVTDGPTPGELSYIRLSRATAFADLYSIEVIYDGGNEEELVSLFNQGIAGQKVGLSRDGSTVQLFVNDMPHSTYEITTPLVPPVGQKHGIRVQAQPDCWVENWSFAPNLPSIYDTFNKADGSPLNPASDGGTWNQWSRDTSLPGSDPSVYPVNDAQIIESNRARIAHVDPVTGGYVAGWIAREIPGTSPNYEFSIDVFRNRAGGSDLGLNLHLLVSEPVGAVSQNAPGYRFSFGQYANTTRVVNTNPGGSASPYAAQAYGAWAQGVTRRLTVRREGAVITMLVDGVVIFTWTDPSPSADTRWAYIPNGDYFDRFDNFLGRELP